MRSLNQSHDRPLTKPVEENLERTGKRRRGPPLWHRKGPRALGAGVVIGAVLALPLLTWSSEQGRAAMEWAHAQAVVLSGDAGLVIRDIQVSGHHQTLPAQVSTAMGLNLGAPLLGFDVDQARTRVEALPWVKSARIIRRLPDQLMVTITERQPLALWQLHGTIEVVDRQGEPVIGANPLAFATLPLVVGKGAARSADDLLGLLASRPILANLVKASVRVGDRRWDIHLQNGVIVRLPEQDAGAAWARLADSPTAMQILERDIEAIDLRWGNRLLVRQPVAPETGTPEKKPAKGA